MTTEQRNEIISLWKELTKRTWNEDRNVAADAVSELAGAGRMLDILGYDIVYPRDDMAEICGEPDVWPKWLIDQNIPVLRDLAIINELDAELGVDDDVEPPADPTDN